MPLLIDRVEKGTRAAKGKLGAAWPATYELQRTQSRFCDTGRESNLILL